MAEHINEFFCTVFTREDTTNIPDPEDKRPRTKLQKIRVTAKKVRKKIGALKTNSAAGPDGIKPSFLQACKEELAPVISMIFRKSLEKGEVPGT